MGKVLLLLVLSASVGGSTLIAQLHIGSTERASRAQEQAHYQLAHDVASSGYALGSHQLERQFAPFAQSNVSYGSGYYDLSATAQPSGRLLLRSSGFAGNTSYDVVGEYVQVASLCDLLGSVFLNVDPATSALQFSGTDFQFRGTDTQPPSGAGIASTVDGPGYTVAGILADSAAESTFTTPLAAAGTLPEPVTVGAVDDESYLRSLIGCTMRLASDAAASPDEYEPGNADYTDRTFGSASSPVTVVIEGDAEFEGETRGYGLLLVGGDLHAHDDFAWEGLVVAFGDGSATIHLANETRVHGGLIGGGLNGETSSGTVTLADALSALVGNLDGGGQVVGPLAQFQRPLLFKVDDEASVYHSAETLARIEALAPGYSDIKTILLNERFGIAAAQ